MNKQDWRNVMMKWLAKIPMKEFERRSTEITRKLIADKLWQQAKMIGVTISMPGEIDTQKIIKKAWEQGKRVAVPKCNPHTRTMDFYMITSFNDLEKGSYKFDEPNVDKTEKVSPAAIDLLIVPGLVYDYNGFRIGYGGGYFDRYLQHFPHSTVSLAFACQVIPEIAREPYDRKVQKLITEEMCYQFE